MRKKSKPVRYCASPTCRNESDAKYCPKCRKRKSRERNPVKDAFNNLKQSARTRGINFFLTFDEFCRFVVDTEYIMRKGPFANDLTIDRKKPDLGYAIGNIQVMTRSDNARKYAKGECWTPVKQSKEDAGTPF